MPTFAAEKDGASKYAINTLDKAESNFQLIHVTTTKNQSTTWIKLGTGYSNASIRSTIGGIVFGAATIPISGGYGVSFAEFVISTAISLSGSSTGEIYTTQYRSAGDINAGTRIKNVNKYYVLTDSGKKYVGTDTTYTTLGDIFLFLHAKEIFMGKSEKTSSFHLGPCWNIWCIICFILLIVINTCFVYHRISLRTTIVLWILFIILFTAGYLAIKKHEGQKKGMNRTKDNKNRPE